MPMARLIHVDRRKVPAYQSHMIGYRAGFFQKSESETNPFPKGFIDTKDKLVAWFVNDCGQELLSHREDYVSFLENYIQIGTAMFVL